MKNVALITGASSGIGRELARIHAINGGDLVVVARREDELESLKIDLEKTYKIKVVVISLDLSIYGAGSALVNEVETRGIEIDFLMNNAGFGGYGEFHNRDLEKEKEMIRLNINSYVEITHGILQGMIKRKKGKILNTASIAGFLPGPLQAVYFATKAFVLSFSQAIDHEVRDHGITVTALCPGPVQTEFKNVAGMGKHPFFKKAKSARYVALIGYRGMLKGRLVAITEKSLSVFVNGIMSFMPRRSILKLIKKLQKH